MSETTPNYLPTQRDERGRFIKGNPGGPGNPFAREMARRRALVASVFTDERILILSEVLFEKAKAGNMQAMNLAFKYAIGMPTPANDPDRVDLEEQKMKLEAPTMADLVAGSRNKLSAEETNEWMDSCETSARHTHLQAIRNEVRRRERKADKKARRDARRQARREKRDAANPPSPNGANGTVHPSPNGANGEYRPPRTGGTPVPPIGG
jgi:hypothetical protein